MLSEIIKKKKVNPSVTFFTFKTRDLEHSRDVHADITRLPIYTIPTPTRLSPTSRPSSNKRHSDSSAHPHTSRLRTRSFPTPAPLSRVGVDGVTAVWRYRYRVFFRPRPFEKFLVGAHLRSYRLVTRM